MISYTQRTWPGVIQRRYPVLTSKAIVIAAERALSPQPGEARPEDA